MRTSLARYFDWAVHAPMIILCGSEQASELLFALPHPAEDAPRASLCQ